MNRKNLIKWLEAEINHCHKSLETSTNRDYWIGRIRSYNITLQFVREGWL